MTHDRRDRLVHFVGLALIACAVFGASLQFHFLSWDDGLNITGNPGVTSGNFAAIWAGPYYGFYIPITYSVWAFLAALANPPNPMFFHFVNIALHILNSFLIYLLARETPWKVTRSANSAAIAACIFLLHPMQVEAVAWVSGLRDVLSGTFALAASLFYLKEPRRSLPAFFLFSAGVLAKPAAAILPLALLTVDLYLARGSFVNIAKRLVPWFAVAAGIACVTVFAQRGLGGQLIPAWYLRPVIALDSLGFYLQKILWPVPLAADYGRTPARVLEQSLFLSTIPLLIMGFFAAYLTRTWLYFTVVCILLLPVLGFIPFAFQYTSTVADHYMYLPMLGAAMAVSALAQRKSSLRIAAWLAVVLFAVISMSRLEVWRNDENFYTEMVRQNPRSFQGWVGIADIADKNGLNAEAANQYRKALEISPENGMAQVGFAKSLLKLGRFETAIHFVAGAVAGKSKILLTGENREYYGQLYFVLGISYQKQNDLLQAQKALAEASILLPNDKVTEAALRSVDQELIEKKKEP